RCYNKAGTIFNSGETRVARLLDHIPIIVDRRGFPLHVPCSYATPLRCRRIFTAPSARFDSCHESRGTGRKKLTSRQRPYHLPSDTTRDELISTDSGGYMKARDFIRNGAVDALCNSRGLPCLNI
ncbi:hypothetical protein AVEN_219885-1, partial [Araneus ventricosus]